MNNNDITPPPPLDINIHYSSFTLIRIPLSDADSSDGDNDSQYKTHGQTNERAHTHTWDTRCGLTIWKGVGRGGQSSGVDRGGPQVE